MIAQFSGAGRSFGEVADDVSEIQRLESILAKQTPDPPKRRRAQRRKAAAKPPPKKKGIVIFGKTIPTLTVVGVGAGVLGYFLFSK